MFHDGRKDMTVTVVKRIGVHVRIGVTVTGRVYIARIHICITRSLREIDIWTTAINLIYHTYTYIYIIQVT